MDKSFYAFDAATSDQQNILINSIRSEQGTGDKLTHFANDLNKLGTNIAGLNTAAQDALIAQGIEWYYWQGTDYAGQEFFTQTGALLQYTTALGAGLQGAQNRVSEYVRTWLNAAYTASTGDTRFAPMGTAFDQWNVSAGTAAVTATARDDTKSQIFIGNTGADTFTGGHQSDVFLAGAGADVLHGGGGYDLLYGGAASMRVQGGTRRRRARSGKACNPNATKVIAVCAMNTLASGVKHHEHWRRNMQRPLPTRSIFLLLESPL